MSRLFRHLVSFALSKFQASGVPFERQIQVTDPVGLRHLPDGAKA